ncbi:hypothetical protein Tco_0855685 [Tanacetum coccineum]
MRIEYCLSERKRLESECEKEADLLKARDKEIESLKAQLLLKETEATEATRFCVQVSATEGTKKMHDDEIDALKQKNMALENEKESLDGKVVHAQEATCSGLRDQVSGYEMLKEQIKEFQDAQMNLVNDKVAKLDADLLEMALHLEEKFYPHLITTISGRRLREVEFPLLAQLKTHKDASTEDVMNLLRLEGPLADAPGMSDLKPDVE